MLRCPNCGADMKDDKLYCYECGEDIHIVPDYDPSMDPSFEGSIPKKKRTLQSETVRQGNTRQESTRQEKARSTVKKNSMSSLEKIKFWSQISILLVLIVVIGTAAKYIWDAGDSGNRNHRSPGGIQTEDGNEEGELISNPVPLIPTPKFSWDEGYYNEIIPLKLSVDADNCKIYYTTDGSDPKERGKLYRDTIFLENGTHEIRAICLADNARYSEEVSKVYQVEILIVEGPEVPTVDGEYSRPTFIEVTIEDDGQHVVYTSDGTDPNPFSKEYTEPIPMPLGPSEFRFAYLDEEGTLSEITERHYVLTLNNAIRLEQAKKGLYNTLFACGKRVEDLCLDEGYGVYRYVYSGVTTIDNMDYYIYDEILVRTNDVTGPTERQYVVHVTTGEVFFLEEKSDGSYRLVELSEIYG